MTRHILKQAVWGLAFAALLVLNAAQAMAGDLPIAPTSPIAGISFDDKPLKLPVQRNFQMAMLTASSELGRSCGRMEAYGWRMEGNEQERVNQLFNGTVDKLRAQGYVVESKTSSAVAKDVTLFSADRTDRHLIMLWSAGEIGLVMVLCETSAPLAPIAQDFAQGYEPPQPAVLPSQLPMASTVRASKRVSEEKPVQFSVGGKPFYKNFSPVGGWIGNYTCSQGTTGATLRIDSVRGDQFTGTFSFYPTSKNPYVPKGSYQVFGEYDADTYRILINPGKWNVRPANYTSTIMIGSFDPVAKTFSGFFQGIMGCTSFEASHDPASSLARISKEVKGEKPVIISGTKTKATDTSKAKAKTKKTSSEKKSSTQGLATKSDAALGVAPTPAAAPIAPVTETAAPAVSTSTTERKSSIDPPTGIEVGGTGK